jgi:uncharacterized protein with NAD-binding domain and iron-sulfur cluster
MSFLIPHEDWGDVPEVNFLVYLCGALEDRADIPPYTDHDFPRREKERVQANIIDWLTRNVGHIWPGLSDPNNPAALNWETLVGSGEGADRLRAQYVRANIDPTERYVMAFPGTTKIRLRADESGFSNMALAGDWVYTSLSAGSIESAVMGGLHAAEAVTGVDMNITGRYPT